MSDEVKPLPVAGYTSQSEANIALANEGKELEERYLRWLDKLARLPYHESQSIPQGAKLNCDQRLVALARTNIQQGAMWAIRSIFQPTRIKLPEDAA